MFAIILAAGEGTRLRPYTLDKPKPMVKVDGKPILEYQIEQLKKAGVDKIVIVERYLSSVIINHFEDGARWNVPVFHLYQKDGSAGAVKQALTEYALDDKPIVVLNGDIISDLNIRDLIEAHRSQDLPITFWTKPYTLSVGLVEEDENNKIIGFREKPTLSIVTGICVVNRGIANELTESGAFFGDIQSFFMGRIRNYSNDSLWLHITDGNDLRIAENELQRRRLTQEGISSRGTESDRTL